MNTKEILEKESKNINKIYIYKEGLIWKAYNQSAMRFIKYIKHIKILSKQIKYLNNEIIYYCGFSDAALKKIKEILNKKNYIITIQQDKYIEISLGNDIFNLIENDFENWKLKIAENDKKKQKKSSLYYDLKIFKSVSDLQLLIATYTKNISKEYKYSYGEKIRDLSIQLSGNIFEINRHYEKTIYFDKLFLNIEYIKTIIKLFYNLKEINENKYAQLSILIDDINKQAINWRNSFNK